MSDRSDQAFSGAMGQRAPMGRKAPPRLAHLVWAVVATVALVAMVVAVAVVLTSRPVQVATPAAPTSVSGLPAPEDGWRWVSRGDVAAQVPEEWGYSDYAWVPWCLGATPEPVPPAGPFVSTPAGPVAAIACPEFQAGWVQTYLGFADPALEPSTLTPVLSRTVADVDVRVTLRQDAPDDERATAQKILDSAVEFERDAAGCTPHAPFSTLDDRPEAWDVSSATGVVEVGLCRHLDSASEGDRPNLSASRVVAGEEAAGLVAAIAAAPEGASGNPDECISDFDQRSGLVLRVLDATGLHDVYLRVDGCRNLGFDDGTAHRELTRDACTPVFSADPIRFDGGQEAAMAACHVGR
ncbi:hypothetical protein [Tessaracoccus sp. Z1128]